MFPAEQVQTKGCSFLKLTIALRVLPREALRSQPPKQSETNKASTDALNKSWPASSSNSKELGLLKLDSNNCAEEAIASNSSSCSLSKARNIRTYSTRKSAIHGYEWGLTCPKE